MQEATEPHLLLVADVVLPGMNGAELARRLADANRSLGVLLISGFTADPQVESLVQRQGFGFLQKPFSDTRFLQTVRDLLDRERPPAPPSA